MEALKVKPQVTLKNILFATDFGVSASRLCHLQSRWQTDTERSSTLHTLFHRGHTPSLAPNP